MSAPDTRFVTCCECDGAGQWDEGPINTASCGGAVDPEYRQVICPACDGFGRYEVEAESITSNDITF